MTILVNDAFTSVKVIYEKVIRRIALHTRGCIPILRLRSRISGLIVKQKKNCPWIIWPISKIQKYWLCILFGIRANICDDKQIQTVPFELYRSPFVNWVVDAGRMDALNIYSFTFAPVHPRFDVGIPFHDTLLLYGRPFNKMWRMTKYMYLWPGPFSVSRFSENYDWADSKMFWYLRCHTWRTVNTLAHTHSLVATK